MLAGPFCTMLLADQGAEIIKVEPLDGDHTRIIGPYHDDDKLRSFGGYFASINRNKKSIAIDLKRPEGRELVMRLCDGADAVVENYRGGVMDRLGLGYETLHERFPSWSTPPSAASATRAPARAPTPTGRPTTWWPRRSAASWPSPVPTRTRR